MSMMIAQYKDDPSWVKGARLKFRCVLSNYYTWKDEGLKKPIRQERKLKNAIEDEPHRFTFYTGVLNGKDNSSPDT